MAGKGPIKPGDSGDVPLEERADRYVDDPELTWFPSSKEELLDYSAAYIQMMIMGADMVKHVQRRQAGIIGNEANNSSEID